MKCALVWRNGFPELRVILSNDIEREYLEAHIGKNVDVEICPAPLAVDVAEFCDCGEPFPESGYCKFCGAHERQRR